MNSERKKILWISPHPIAPPYTGGQIRTFSLIKNLADRFDIILVCPKPLSGHVPRAVRYLKELRQVKIVQLNTPIRKLLRRDNPLGQFYGPLSLWHKALHSIMISENPSAVVLEHVWHAETLGYLRKNYPSAKYILNMHNIESLNVRRYASLHMGGLTRGLVIGRLQNKIEKLECNLRDSTDMAWCCSDYDADILKSINRGPSLKMDVVPNGVDVKSFNFDISSEKYKQKKVVFVGTLRYPPAENAVMWFYKDVWPIVIKKMPDMKFRIVGSDPSDRLKRAVSADASVEFIGDVPDVRPHYDESSVSVCPILSGSGTRIKIIESMASGTPVVSTTIGAEGLEAVPGQDIIIADRPEDFAEAIVRLFLNRELYEKIRQNGRILVENKYDWGKISEIALSSIDNLINDPGPYGISISDPAKIRVVAAADDKFAMPLAVAFRSAISNLRPGREIEFFIIDAGFGRKNKFKLRASVGKGVKINWIKPDMSRLDRLFVSGHLTKATYLKLFIPDVLPKTIDKAIYLDSDIVVSGDLGTLWDIGIGEEYLLAIRDAYPPSASTPGAPLTGYPDLGREALTKYFNAGVMVMNLKRWRKERLSEKVLEYAEKAGNALVRHDQDAMNAVLAGKWGELDIRWNMQKFNYSDKFLKDNPFNEKFYNEVTRNPYIAHFTTADKPWLNIWCQHPAKDLFFKYLDSTAWKGWRPTMKELIWQRMKAKVTV